VRGSVARRTGFSPPWQAVHLSYSLFPVPCCLSPIPSSLFPIQNQIRDLPT
jgi:hypothetical protein